VLLFLRQPLVVHYLNADRQTGKLPKGAMPQIEIKYVQLSISNFRSISRLIEEEVTLPDETTRPGTASDMDVLMYRNDRAFGFEFSKIASQPRWKQYPEIVAAV